MDFWLTKNNANIRDLFNFKLKFTNGRKGSFVIHTYVGMYIYIALDH